jgi:hypothetical protein
MNVKYLRRIKSIIGIINGARRSAGWSGSQTHWIAVGGHEPFAVLVERDHRRPYPPATAFDSPTRLARGRARRERGEVPCIFRVWDQPVDRPAPGARAPREGGSVGASLPGSDRTRRDAGAVERRVSKCVSRHPGLPFGANLGANCAGIVGERHPLSNNLFRRKCMPGNLLDPSRTDLDTSELRLLLRQRFDGGLGQIDGDENRLHLPAAASSPASC